MSKQRDPHMPPPEAVDWLLAQEWSKPLPTVVTTSGRRGVYVQSAKLDLASATVAIGAAEYATIFMPAEALDALKAVAITDAKEAVANHSEDAPMRRILKLIENDDFNGVLQTAVVTLIKGMRCIAAKENER